MKRKTVALFLVLSLFVGLFAPTYAAAASDAATAAANALYYLGLFKGVGTNADGTPNFELDRRPTRAEGVTMLVRLLGAEEEAKAEDRSTPFVDVADWAKPYVGYAYENGLTNGTSAATYGSDEPISATQYITFVLRSLGFESGVDFRWDSAWTLSDRLGITDGRYNASTNDRFTRGDVAIVSIAAYNYSSAGQGALRRSGDLSAIGSRPCAPDLMAWLGLSDGEVQWSETAESGGHWFSATARLELSDRRHFTDFLDDFVAQIEKYGFKLRENCSFEIDSTRYGDFTKSWQGNYSRYFRFDYVGAGSSNVDCAYGFCSEDYDWDSFDFGVSFENWYSLGYTNVSVDWGAGLELVDTGERTSRNISLKSGWTPAEPSFLTAGEISTSTASDEPIPDPLPGTLSECYFSNGETFEMQVGDAITFFNTRTPISTLYAYTWIVEDGKDLVLLDRNGPTCKIYAKDAGTVRISANLDYTIDYGFSFEHKTYEQSFTIEISPYSGSPSAGYGIMQYRTCPMCGGAKTISVGGERVDCPTCRGSGTWLGH